MEGAMKIRAMTMAGALAAALVVPAAAEAAWYGVAAGKVNLRTGPSTAHARITVVPAGARLTVFRCFSWCQVRFAGITGWMSAKYVASGRGYASRYIVGPSPYVVGPSPFFWGPAYPGPYWGSPYWHHRPGVTFWFGF
jgi:uncharacterized protein YraI